MSLRLESSAFTSEGSIPMKYTKEGENLSPPLEWSDEPNGTKEFALIMEDPDAPKPKPFVHWLVYRIQPHVHMLQEGISAQPTSFTGSTMLQGKNSFGDNGYGGPLPPEGDPAHHYNFHLYALDQPLNVQGGLNREELMQVMEGHILSEATLVGTYQRTGAGKRYVSG